LGVFLDVPPPEVAVAGEKIAIRQHFAGHAFLLRRPDDEAGGLR
jgi:hypothetical protein